MTDEDTKSWASLARISRSCCTDAADVSVVAECLATLELLRKLPQPSGPADATTVARIARWGSTRPLRRAATLLLQSTLFCARSSVTVSQGVTLLLEGLQLCVQTVHARAVGSGAPADSPDSAWQAAMTLSALWHTFEGKVMPEDEVAHSQPGEASLGSSGGPRGVCQLDV